MMDGMDVRLVFYASVRNITIYVNTIEQAKHLENLAKELGVTIPTPVSLDAELEKLRRNNA